MASPSKKLLNALRQKRFGMENYKSLNDIPKGIKFPVQKFVAVESRQYGKDNKAIENPEVPIYTLAVYYKIGSFTYYTYLPGDFQSKDKKSVEENCSTLNDGILNEPLNFIYYGKPGSKHLFDFLDDNEGIVYLKHIMYESSILILKLIPAFFYFYRD